MQFLIALVVALVSVAPASARDHGENGNNSVASRLLPPDVQERVHKTGNVHFMVTNYGTFGNQADASIIDPETGAPGPSCQFPAASGIEYLYQGALWIGAIVDGDTLVSSGQDGWMRVSEMFPDGGQTSQIIKRSNIPSSPFYDINAVSEADFISTYFDTLTDRAYVEGDFYDNRPHRPLGLKIVQESYSWSSSGLDNFVIVKERLVNFGTHNLNDVCVGLYFDGDVGHFSSNNYFYDDITGSTIVPADATGYETLAAWIADADGDPTTGGFDYRSPKAAFGVAVLQQPMQAGISYNWWTSNGEAFWDWGPMLSGDAWPFFTGGSGTPSGDRNKYYLMTRPCRDFDQLWTAVDMTSLGWKPRHPDPSYAVDLSNGTDAKFLLSFKLGELAPGDSTEFVFVVAMGDNFHKNPQDFVNLFSAQNPMVFADALDHSNLIQTIQRARLQYRLATTGLLGDANSDLRINISDAVFLIQYLFSNGVAPEKPNLADVNADCEVSLPDAVYVVNFIFGGGPYPLEGCAAK